jgi:hypothetical protein
MLSIVPALDNGQTSGSFANNKYMGALQDCECCALVPTPLQEHNEKCDWAERT